MNTARVTLLGMLALFLAVGTAATSAAPPVLKVSVDALKNGGALATKYAFCVPAAQGHSTAGSDISPSISWSKGPAGTKSYAIVFYDSDWPAEQRDKMNKEGMTLGPDVPRRNYYQWVLVDIPPSITSLKEGAESSARVLHGKPATPAVAGVRGLNDFTKVTASNEAMKGQYYGYDGPCPPWNDEVVHHYHFTVYALGVGSLGLPAEFDGAAAMEAMKGKILGQGELLALYTQNPAKGAQPQ